MKRLITSLIIISLAQTAGAAIGRSYEATVDNTYGASSRLLQDDPRLLTPEIYSIIQDISREQVADATSSAISQVNGAMGFATKCTRFATAKEMGAWGEIIIQELKRSRPAYILNGTKDLAASCPKYPRLNEAGRQAVWVMILSAMAHLESSCRTEITAKGPNGTLIGLLQLHHGEEQKYASGCKKGDGKTAEGTFRCGLSMLDLQLKKRGALFARQSYWDVLRPQAELQKYKKIQAALAKFSICK